MSNLETILSIKVDGTSDMVDLKNAMDATQKELKQLKDEQKNAGKDSDKYNKSIVEAETKLKAMRSEMNRAKTEIIKTNQALNAQGKSYNDLQKRNAKLSIELRKLQDPLGKNRKEFNKISAEMNKNTEQLKKMDQAMGRNQRNVGNYGAAISGMAVKLGAAVMAFKTLERAIGSFSDFEFQIKQVGVISGATAEEMKRLEKNAKDLGSSTAFTAGEVAGLQVELSKLGFKADEVEQMTSSILDLSFAFGNELGETSEQVGITLRSFNLEASEASRVTDVMAAAFSNSALDLSKFATAMPKVASVAASVGFTLEDTTTILGQLANTGLDASTAGTSLRNIFLKLADPAGDLAKSLGRNITSVDELIPAMKELQASGIDVAGALEITDKRSVTAFLSMLKNADSMNDLNKVLKNSQGITKQFADVMRDSLKGSIDETKSAAEGFIIELIDGLSPAITLILDGISGLFRVLKALSPVILTATAAFVSYKAVLVASNGITKVISASTAAYTAISKLFTTSTKGATIAQRAFNVAVKANPIGLLLSGIAAAVTLWSQFKDNAEDSADAMAEIKKEREDFVEINAKADKQQNAEIANVKQLISKIKNESLSRKERTKAIEDLNKVTPITIDNLDDEKKLAAQLSTAYDNAVKSIKAKIILQASEEKVIALINEELALQDQLQASLDREAQARLTLRGITDVQVKDGVILGKFYDEQTDQYYENADAVEFLGDEIGTFVNAYRYSSDKYDEATNDFNNATLTANSEITVRNQLTAKMNELQDKQTDIMEQSQKTIQALNITKVESNNEDEKTITAYERLKNNVNDAMKALQEQAATNGDVEAAAKKLAEAKKKLADVDKKVTDEMAKNDDKLKNTNAGLQEKIAKQEELIKVEENQLKSIEKLEKAGADLAREQIEQALKVAKAKLELYLMEINMSTESADVQAENINKVKKTIEDLNTKLKEMGASNQESAPSGFMNKALFGTGGDDGEGAFTGGDFVNGLSSSLGMAMDLLAGFNEFQNAQTDAELQNMQTAKETEINDLKETAEFARMTEEQKADAIEAIEKRHDGEMLKLKIDQFEKNKKFQRSQAIMAGAMAVMQIWSSTATGNAIADAIIKGILTAGMVALTGMQIATINSAPPPTAELGGIVNETFADGGMVHGRSHAEGGEKFRVGGRVVELEGGEAVINKRSTAMFRSQLSAMNEAGGGKKFADGGLTFATDILQDQSMAMANALSGQAEQQVIMVEADVTDTQKSVENIEAQATF